jgi:hypothetical protein
MVVLQTGKIHSFRIAASFPWALFSGGFSNLRAAHFIELALYPAKGMVAFA